MKAAVVVLEPELHALNLAWQRRENDQRDRMTPWICEKIALALCNMQYMCVSDEHDRRHSSEMLKHLALMEAFPGYTRIRDYLVIELGARYLVACCVAFAHATSFAGTQRYRLTESRFAHQRQRGWL